MGLYTWSNNRSDIKTVKDLCRIYLEEIYKCHSLEFEKELLAVNKTWRDVNPNKTA